MNARDDWADYVSQVYEARPQTWLNVGQLPSFKPDVFALALRAFPWLLDDVKLDETMLADRFESEGGIQAAREYIADSVMAILRRDIKQRLLEDLQAHAAQLEANAATAECERLNYTHEQYSADIRGVR